jgi:hypothetical protein
MQFWRLQIYCRFLGICAYLCTVKRCALMVP